jgi:hypothetical protein
MDPGETGISGTGKGEEDMTDRPIAGETGRGRRCSFLWRGNRDDRGASALEWAIIAAIAVVFASLVATSIKTVITDKTGQLEHCANAGVGEKC